MLAVEACHRHLRRCHRSTPFEGCRRLAKGACSSPATRKLPISRLITPSGRRA